MKHQTSSLHLCGQPTVLALTQSTTRLVEAVGSCVPQLRDVDQLIEEWEHFHQVVIDKAVRQWRPRLGVCVRLHAHGGHFLTQTLDVLKSCHSHGRTLDSQSRLCLWWTLMLVSDLTKLAVAVADVARFY